jgi:MATE family multidrug resistance protein
MLLQWSELKPLLALKGNVFIRTLALLCVYTFFIIHSAQFGALVLAANAILLNLLMFSSYGLDGLANVTESFVGVAIGEQQPIKLILRNTLISAAVVALMLAVIYCVGGRYIIYLQTNLASVRVIALHYLPWAYIYPILAVWAFWLDGVFIGATKGAAMRNTMLVAMIRFFVLWYFTQSWQNNGLWFMVYGFRLWALW